MYSATNLNLASLAVLALNNLEHSPIVLDKPYSDKLIDRAARKQRL
jgi:hypothetical protein